MASTTPDDVEQYRSLSNSALAAFVLGLLSPLAFAAPLLLLFPLVGAAMGISALRRIMAPESGLSGLFLARCGLMLAVTCGVGAVVRLLVRDALL